MSPFLSVITRHLPERKENLQDCLSSLTLQTCQDFEQIILVDHVHRGLGWANGQFAAHRDAPTGDYVLMLDDDDALIRTDTVETLRSIANSTQADIIIFRGIHPPHGVLPTPACWGQKPIYGHISGQDFIVRRALWRQHIEAFAQPQAGDFAFLEALWAAGCRPYWHDALFVRIQQRGHGR